MLVAPLGIADSGLGLFSLGNYKGTLMMRKTVASIMLMRRTDNYLAFHKTHLLLKVSPSHTHYISRSSQLWETVKGSGKNIVGQSQRPGFVSYFHHAWTSYFIFLNLSFLL